MKFKLHPTDGPKVRAINWAERDQAADKRSGLDLKDRARR